MMILRLVEERRERKEERRIAQERLVVVLLGLMEAKIAQLCDYIS
jgi:hypothetical protein